MNVVDKVLIILGSTVGGVSIGAILFFLIKFIFTKINSKSQVKALTNAMEKSTTPEIIKNVLGGIKDTTFKHSIEPIVISNLEKINEIALKDFTKQVEILNKKYDNIINIFEKLGACFDNSAISQETKTALKNAILEAKEEKVEVVETKVEVVEEPKKEKKVVAKKENDILL